MQSTTSTMDQLKETVKEFQSSIEDLDKIITDPKIREILANLADTTNALAASVRQLDEMLKSGTATAQDVQAVADKIREQ